ncbi:cation:proton antiporter subunit C [Flexistipes sp.]|uniref:cation:proton antiporter subunit C n=1 Tax=Flexistipes sp. TaxID=3088135 RepID=UPI002E1E5772|nr:cation:proton antiporter subunit C [Flexistipes sp.]
MIEFIADKYNFWIAIVLMMIGFYAIIAKHNLVKKVIGLNIFQTSVFLFYISISKVNGGTAPIIWHPEEHAKVVYDNPLPHVLILTAIVVSVSVTAVALGIIVKLYKNYGSIEDDEIKIRELKEPELDSK